MKPNQAIPEFFANVGPTKDVGTLSLAEVFEQYLSYYASGGTHTAKAKRLDIQRFCNFLAKHRSVKHVQDLVVSDWDFSDTKVFVETVLKSGEAPSTAARRLATLKHAGRILAERIPGFVNPARDVKGPKIQILRPKSISAEEVEKIKDFAAVRTLRKKSFNRYRNEIIFKFLLDTGLRAEEVRTLRLGQIDTSYEWISKVRTKGQQFRNVYITSALRSELKEYCDRRHSELLRVLKTVSPALSAKLPLFISVHSCDPKNVTSFQMSPKSVWRAVRESSVDTKLHPHLLRHTFASDLLSEAKDIRLVAQALGHSDVKITMRYTERSNEEVAEALERTRKKKGL